MDYDDILLETDDKMERTVERLASEFNTIRTGRATRGLVENLRVDYYGEPTPLGQAANISIPDPRLIVIKPYDPSQLATFEKAILKSELGIHPANDGKVIRLEIPPLTEERRNQLVKQVKDLAEKAKVAINNVRREANRLADAAKEDKAVKLAEDDVKRLKGEIDEFKNTHHAKIEALFEKKADEIRSI